MLLARNPNLDELSLRAQPLYARANSLASLLACWALAGKRGESRDHVTAASK